MITRNSARCLECGDHIESTYRHDFKACSCGSVMVDGGHDYIKRGFVPGARWEDTSLVDGLDENGNQSED